MSIRATIATKRRPQPGRYRRRLSFAFLFLTLAWGAPSICAVILFNTADPTANTTAPGGSLAESGWQYEGKWGDLLGTPIAPQFFISAGHIFNAGNSVFTYQNVNYSVVNGFYDPFSDFVIWQISAAQTFPTFAPLYNSLDEVGQHLVAIGCGRIRGTEFVFNGTLRGWNWGPGDGAQRWGENIVTSIVSDPDFHELIYSTFDSNGLPNEAHLAEGDSGGGLFLQDQGGVWKLAGIHFSVDGGYYTDSAGANPLPTQALFDTRDLYYKDQSNPPHYTQITGPYPVPTGFYSTRISSSLDWIYSVTDPTGDADGNGTPNLLQYALALNSAPVRGYGATTVDVNGGFVSLTYRKITTAAPLQYQVEQSSDLLAWSNATTQDEVVSTRGNIQTIKAKVALGSNARMFLRLKITQTAGPVAAAKTTSRRGAYKTGSGR